ncbi:hypothetical protein KCP73_19120 [Salmonella enterica subsp. enterica]|nr:hypothetical protein KCP73_19120 [Salmonella enterica subsp. enterica]
MKPFSLRVASGRRVFHVRRAVVDIILRRHHHRWSMDSATDSTLLIIMTMRRNARTPDPQPVLAAFGRLRQQQSASFIVVRPKNACRSRPPGGITSSATM